MRHAETESVRPSLKDFDRALTEHGQQEAVGVAHYLRANELTPELILHSPARRARETVTTMIEQFETPPNTEESRKLYLASPEDITNSAQLIPDQVSSAAFVGHSPGLPTAALFMAGPATDLNIIDGVSSGYPPGSMVVLRFNIEKWSDLCHAQGNLERFVRPSDM